MIRRKRYLREETESTIDISKLKNLLKESPISKIIRFDNIKNENDAREVLEDLENIQNGDYYLYIDNDIATFDRFEHRITEIIEEVGYSDEAIDGMIEIADGDITYFTQEGYKSYLLQVALELMANDIINELEN